MCTKLKYRKIYGQEISKLNDNFEMQLIKYSVVAAKASVKSCFSLTPYIKLHNSQKARDFLTERL